MDREYFNQTAVEDFTPASPQVKQEVKGQPVPTQKTITMQDFSPASPQTEQEDQGQMPPTQTKTSVEVVDQEPKPFWQTPAGKVVKIGIWAGAIGGVLYYIASSKEDKKAPALAGTTKKTASRKKVAVTL